MSFNITFNGQKTTYSKPVSVLDVVGGDKNIVCAYVNNRVRELTYILEKDAVVVPLTTKDRDAKQTYEDLLKNATTKEIEEQKDATINSLEEQINALQDYIDS